jgi:hypothetical protein
VTVSTWNVKARVKLLGDAWRGRQRDADLLFCISASGLLGGGLALTRLPASPVAKDLLVFALSCLVCRIAAMALK